MAYPIPSSLPRGMASDLGGPVGLNAWPNLLFTLLLLALTCFFAWQRGYSPLELVSTRADQRFVEALQGRFGAAHLPLRKHKDC